MTPDPTIRTGHVRKGYCPHCEAMTAQVGAPPATWPKRKANATQAGVDYEAGTCLQCIADGAVCCSLKRYSRWT